MLWAWTSFKAFTLKLLISNLSPQMSQVTKLVLDPGETIEERIESVLAIMSEDVSVDDRLVLQHMLEQALEMKKKSECQTLADLRKKYGSKKNFGGGHKRC